MLLMFAGKTPPPYYGTTIWYEIVKEHYLTQREDVGYCEIGIHMPLDTIGELSLRRVVMNVLAVMKYVSALVWYRPKAVHIPVSQSVSGLMRDSLYIIVAACMRRKVVVHLHGSVLDTVIINAPTLYRRYLLALLSNVSYGVVLSERFKSALYNLGIKRCIVIRNGANYELPQRRRSTDTVRILFLSNLQRSKGIELLLSSLSILQSDTTSWAVDVVGNWRDSETESNALRFVQENELPVTFHGPKYGHEKYQFYVDSDIFVFTPLEQEGHPWVINEALAAGLPIVATDRGMIEDAVQNGRNGFVIKDDKPLSIANSLDILIQSKQARSEMGQVSRSVYLESYTLRHMIAEIDKMVQLFL